MWLIFIYSRLGFAFIFLPIVFSNGQVYTVLRPAPVFSYFLSGNRNGDPNERLFSLICLKSTKGT